MNIFSVSRKIAKGLDLIGISVHTIYFICPLEMWCLHGI